MAVALVDAARGASGVASTADGSAWLARLVEEALVELVVAAGLYEAPSNELLVWAVGVTAYRSCGVPEIGVAAMLSGVE
jgi:hypothetical protein